MEQHSKNFYKVKNYYDTHRWTKQMVANVVTCNPPWITAAEYEEIVGEPYPSN